MKQKKVEEGMTPKHIILGFYLVRKLNTLCSYKSWE